MDDSDRLSKLRAELRRQLGAERFALWFESRTRLAWEHGILRVYAASSVEMQWLRRKLHQTLLDCARVDGVGPTIVYEVDEHVGDLGTPSCAIRAASDDAVPANAPLANRGAPSVSERRPVAPTLARRTFDDLVVGDANRLAVQAAYDVVCKPGRFSPLVLSGPPGSGKSHLLQGIEHAARLGPYRVRALLLTAEQFTAQFVEALDRRALPGLRHKLRSLDLLLIDDVQFFAGKNATMNELLHTIDALQGRGGQVALTCDAPLGAWPAASADLASRVAAGLAVGVDLPDYAMRLGIVQTMANRMAISLDEAVAELIARHVSGSVRLLSGAINRLVAVAMALGKPATVELAEATLAEFCRQHLPPVRLGDIQRAVCEVFGVESAMLRSTRKTRSAAGPRMLAMWLARRYTRAALSEIGDYFGGRSHSTVVSAKRRLDSLMTAGGELTIGDQSCPVEEALRRVEAALRAS